MNKFKKLVAKWRGQAKELEPLPGVECLAMETCASELELALKAEAAHPAEGMRIFIARSVSLFVEAHALADRLSAASYEVSMPCAVEGKTELGIFKLNAQRIRKADVVLALWNGISDGTPMDVAMAIALRKPVYVQTMLDLPPGFTCLGGGSPLLPRAWALFSELGTIDDFLRSKGILPPCEP
jgi:hypothetical protein